MLKKILTKISGNYTVQKILEKNILISLYMSGIGSGGEVKSSAEKITLNLLPSTPGVSHILGMQYNLPYCIFDVGANKGQYLNLLYNELLNRDFKIYSFEPSKYTFDILVKNSPNSSKVILNNIAFGKENGKFILYSNEKGSGLASLTKRKLNHFNIEFNESEEIQLTTLDDYCSQNNINHIHLLKLDVEGHELDVLEGSAKMFTNKSIDIVSFEFGGCNIDTRSFFQDYFYFFREQKMKIYRITPSGYLFPIEKYKEQYEQFITTNFIATKTT